MKTVRFISYDGEYPCLCYGILKIEVDGKIWELENALVSNGSCGVTDDDGAYCITAPWSADLPEQLQPYEKEITALVNENVAWGCCGGCI